MRPVQWYQTELADEDLKQRVVTFLVNSKYASLRAIEVQAISGTVTLRGEVRSFYEKQLGQEGCRRVAGVTKVVNAIDVLRFPLES